MNNNARHYSRCRHGESSHSSEENMRRADRLTHSSIYAPLDSIHRRTQTKQEQERFSLIFSLRASSFRSMEGDWMKDGNQWRWCQSLHLELRPQQIADSQDDVPEKLSFYCFNSSWMMRGRRKELFHHPPLSIITVRRLRKYCWRKKWERLWEGDGTWFMDGRRMGRY